MGYANFKTAIYCPVANLNAIHDLEAFDRDFAFLEQHIRIDKVYLETYRGNEFISRERMLELKAFFEKRGIRTAGGITTSDAYHEEDLGYTSMCYTNEVHRNRLKDISEMTAAIFDEIILDDFFFTNCKCASCAAAKGKRSWAEFRTELLLEVSQSLIIGPAKRVNPNVKMVIKFPNWYEGYQETGYNLKDEPGIYDGIYTGTETRDPMYTMQHLPKYLGYFLMRYLENVKPGGNGGGWFDLYECGWNMRYYTQQADLTVFGKAKEITLFCLEALLETGGRMYVPPLGKAFEALDTFAGSLGNPFGTACYLPYHSAGEDYLHNYVGMLGIPLEPMPEYPADNRKVFLTQSASADPDILEKISRTLQGGGDVIVTSGFVREMQDKGFGHLANIRVTGRSLRTRRFCLSLKGTTYDMTIEGEKDVLLPWITYHTNDIWQLAGGLGEDNQAPVLLAQKYGQGYLYILTVPDDFGEFYHYPEDILSAIRVAFQTDSSIALNAPAKVAIFTYDNDTFVVQSFLEEDVDAGISVGRSDAVLVGLQDGKSQQGVTAAGRTTFSVTIPASEYRAYLIK